MRLLLALLLASAIAPFTSSEETGLANAWLMTGKRDAILVDTAPTADEARRLADQIAKSGKRLTHIFLTSAHADHLLGLDVLTARFPAAKVVSTAGVVKDVETRGPDMLTVAQRRWGTRGPRRLVAPQAIEELTFEGTRLQIIEQSGIAALYDPKSRTLFAGDFVTNGAHPDLRDKRIAERLRALDALEKVNAERILPGHGPAGGIELIAATRRYLQDFAAAIRLGLPETAKQRMLKRYPRHRARENLERSVAAQFPG
jgi:glyoxylase-like metal-dependent hydrolase (beta-lactamase superfamily II)